MISFAIPAHNEEPLLPATLGAIHRCAGALGWEYEIVVADDGSTDRTGDIARERGAHVVRIDRRQISAARNAAARASRGAYLFFADADTQVTMEALREGLDAMRSGAAGGGCMVRFDGRIPRWSSMLLAALSGLFRLLRLSGGATVFCTRDAFERSGGWDERLFAGEEISFAKALKRHGRFVIPRGVVETSGRKLRAYRAREVLGTLWRLGLGGRRALGQREGLEIWYGARREDPMQRDERRRDRDGMKDARGVGPGR